MPSQHELMTASMTGACMHPCQPVPQLPPAEAKERATAVDDTSALMAISCVVSFDGEDFTTTNWCDFDEWDLGGASEQEANESEVCEMVEDSNALGELLGAMVVDTFCELLGAATDVPAAEYCELWWSKHGDVYTWRSQAGA